MKKYLFYSSRILGYAVKLEIIQDNPMEKITKPKTKQEPHKFNNFYTKSKLNQFLHCCKNNGNFKIYTFF